MHLGRIGNDDAIDQDTGHLHVFRLDRALLDDAFHLDDDDAAIVVRRHGLSQAIERQRFFLHADVSRRVGTGAANEGDIDFGGFVEEPLFTLDLDELDDVLLRHRVDLSTAEARIDIGVKADLGEQARLARRAGAVQLRDDALRKVVAPNLIRLSGLRDLRHAPKIGGNHALQKTFVVQAARPETFAVASAGAHDEREILRRSGLDKALLERSMQCLGNAALHKTRRRDYVVVADESNCFFGPNDLVCHLGSFPR